VLTAPLLLPVVAAAGVIWRIVRERHVERAYAARFAATPSGIVAGAEPFTLTGTNGRALLLLHGSGDTPQTLRHLAERLHAVGYTVHAPLLPGHGRSPRDFTRVSAQAYLAAARKALDQLRRDAGWIGVGGLSMGAAIAAQLAAEAADVRVLVLLAPYLSPSTPVSWAARTSMLWGLVQPYVRGRGDNSVHDPVARAANFAYGVFPPSALRALVDTAAVGRDALPRVTVPTLVVNSRDDNRIPEALASTATAALRAETERYWVTGCGHIITVDYCKDAVADLVLGFLARHVH
jgi:carboxylesterase